MKGETLRPNIIIWDLDGTVWGHRSREVEVTMFLENLGKNYLEQISIEYGYMLKEFNPYFTDKIVTFSGIAKFIEKMMPGLFFMGITGQEFLKAMTNVNTTVLNQEAEKLIKYFSSNNKKNIVLTDWLLKNQLNILEKYGLLQYIEEVHSCEGKYLKCNPKTIPNIIKDGMNEEYLMIGDSLISDIAFANKANIASVWYNPDGKANITSYKPTFEVNSLLEIPELISIS